MPTIAAGRVVSILWPTDGQITITPGSAGRVSLNARGRDGSQSIAPREIYNAETINVSAGDTVILEAINTDATYTSPASGDVVVSTWAEAISAAQVAADGGTVSIKNPLYTGGPGGTRWTVSAGALRPAGGRVGLGARVGSIASPLATLTGTTAALFTIPVIPILPANIIQPHTTLVVRALVRKTTGTAAAFFNAYVGTTGVLLGDARVGLLTIGAAANTDGRLDCAGSRGEGASAMLVTRGLGQQTAVATAVADDSTGVNFSAQMLITFGVSGANASDSFSLLAYSVALEG